MECNPFLCQWICVCVYIISLFAAQLLLLLLLIMPSRILGENDVLAVNLDGFNYYLGFWVSSCWVFNNYVDGFSRKASSAEQNLCSVPIAEIGNKPSDWIGFQNVLGKGASIKSLVIWLLFFEFLLFSALHEWLAQLQLFRFKWDQYSLPTWVPKRWGGNSMRKGKQRMRMIPWKPRSHCLWVEGRV